MSSPACSAPTDADRAGSAGPVATAEMLIRRPAADVFQAFADPAVTTNFWFTRSSGPLAPGAEVRWEWQMYGVSARALVREFIQDREIEIDWGGDDEIPTRVRWQFTPHREGTIVTITNDRFPGTSEDQIAAALDSAGGFALVIAGLKAWLEHGIHLNLTADRFPPSAE